MLVGVCQIDLFVPDSGSLKSKRFILTSLKTRIRNKFNVSISEVDGNDKWQRVTLAVSMVANERKLIDQTMTQILNLISQDGRCEILNHVVEVL
ncbi:MAG: DUF503 domain-containing protein [candidate division KSB1 bacterium]|nr:DUF503 domain-containing protein [candidate division KSB1 bacterium]